MTDFTVLRFNKYSDQGGTLYGKRYNDMTLYEIPFEYTFFAKPGAIANKGVFRTSPSDKKDYFTGELVDKVILTDLSVIKEGIPSTLFSKTKQKEVFQFDLGPDYQHLVYNKIKLSDKYKVAYLDIETDDDLDAEAAIAPILLISIVWKEDGVIKKKHFSLNDYDRKHQKDNEKDMLNDFFKYITEENWPDIILGWNVKDFDKRYIINKAKNLGIYWNATLNYKWFMIEFINGSDIIIKKEGYGILKKTKGMKLDNMAKHFLGRGKTGDGGKFGDLYRSNFAKALEYNVNDNLLVLELNEKLNLIPFLINLQSISNCFIRDTFYNSIIIDMMVLNRYPENVFQSRWKDGVEPEEYEGGFVKDPPSGVFENVVGFDVAGMYPSLIMTFNLSPDSKVLKGDFTVDGIQFNADPPSLFKETIKYVYDTRFRLKAQLKTLDKNSTEYLNLDSLQTAFKTVLNSVYGVMAFQDYRLHDVDIAKTITWLGRELIQHVNRRVEEYKLGDALYSDTDSSFIKVAEDPEKILTKINDIFIPEFVNSFYPFKENFVKMEIKDVYKKMVFFGKKKVYICQLEDGELYHKGGTIERYDTPSGIRPLLSEIFKKLFNGDKIDLLEYREKIKKLTNLELSMIKKMNKSPEEYKVKPQQLKAIENSTEILKLNYEKKRWSLVKMLYVQCSTHPEVNVIAIDEETKIPDSIVINYNRYFLQFIVDNLLDHYNAFGFDSVIGLPVILKEFTFKEKFIERLKKKEMSKKDQYQALFKLTIKMTEEPLDVETRTVG